MSEIDIPLDNVDSHTYLEILINNNRFSFTDHIDYIRGKISKKLCLFKALGTRLRSLKAY